MKIEHLAIWVNDLERVRLFYKKYFNAVSTDKYVNTKTGFESYFLSFDGGSRLELMKRADIVNKQVSYGSQHTGIIHFAMDLGSKEKVDNLTELLRNDGYSIVGEPRITGDGYYESVILDPEGNIVELIK